MLSGITAKSIKFIILIFSSVSIPNGPFVFRRVSPPCPHCAHKQTLPMPYKNLKKWRIDEEWGESEELRFRFKRLKSFLQFCLMKGMHVGYVSVCACMYVNMYVCLYICVGFCCM